MNLKELFENLPPELQLIVVEFVYFCKLCKNRCFIDPEWDYYCDACKWSCCPKECWSDESDEPNGCGGGCLCMTKEYDEKTPKEDTIYFYLYRRPQLVKAVKLVESRVRFVKCDYFNWCYGSCINAVRYREDEHGPLDSFNDVNHGVVCREHSNCYYTPTCDEKYCGEPGSNCNCESGWHKD